MKKLFCFLFLFIIVNLAAIAQRDPQFSFNKLTHLTVNPGFAGSSNGINGVILNRYQWAGGLEGAPQTMVFSVGAQTKLFGADGGIGINAVSDEAGFEKTSRVNFNYAYRTSTGIGDLGIGASFGFISMTMNGEWYIPGAIDPNYNPWIDAGNDEFVPNNEINQMLMDVGFGVYLQSRNYFIGASVTHINQPELKNEYNNGFDFFTRHYYLLGGYNISLTDPLFVLQPSVFVKTDMAGLQADIQVELTYNNKISGGLKYRLQDAIGVLFKYELPNGLRAGYAFDLTTSALSRYGWGSHELFISYTLDLGKSRLKKYKSVRFL